MAGIAWTLLNRQAFASFDLRAWVEGFGWAGPFLFMGLYALATLLFLPGSLLTLAGGAVFGLGPGTFYNLTGATVGAGLSFLAARHLLGDWVESKTRGRLAQLKQGVEREGWQFVAFVRLIPLFPFNLLNYALGLTRIRFWTYLAVTYLAMLPGAFVYTYIGVVGKNALAGQDNLAQIGPQALLALGLLALVIYLPKLYLARKSSKPAMMSVEELKEGLSGSELLLVDLRDEEDYRSRGFIPQGQNIPLARLRESMDGLLGYKEEPIALICTTSIRSFKAYELLRKEGFQKVAVVDGGIKQWSEKGFSLRSNQEDPA